MNKENTTNVNFGMPTVRLTRARAAAAHVAGGANITRPPLGKSDQLRIPRGSSKRSAVDENNQSVFSIAPLQPKRRAVLKEVTNICGDSSYEDCIHTSKIQHKNLKISKAGPSNVKCSDAKKRSKLPSVSGDGKTIVQEDEMVKKAADAPLVAIVNEVELNISIKSEGSSSAQANVESVHDAETTCSSTLRCKQTSLMSKALCPSKITKDEVCESSKGTNESNYVDIDTDHKNPQMCCIYVSDIYINLRVDELEQRPCSNFMETLQRDITQSMRAILIDWLVEVAEEYKLVPDTLYLTIHMIDRFLSKNYIERQKLQLLGIACMLIASKYEEICAPRVEEFCFITDNTYSREDVLNMEIQVLNNLGFHLSIPTIKTFLRRFLRAAQATNEVPTLVLEFLANYLAELTLIEYGFLKFAPSIIAASAVFLAQWTLDRSCHPWNSTLEHYTSYKPSDLKITVSAMQCLQMNSTNCPLHAIREKYRLVKFKSVANLPHQELHPMLFS